MLYTNDDTQIYIMINPAEELSALQDYVYLLWVNDTFRVLITS